MYKYLFFFFLLPNFLNAQSYFEIKSLVKDRSNKNPLPYVNIGFVDRGVGTVSDQDGYFELSFSEKHIQDSDVLQITSAGYYPLRLSKRELKSVFDKTKVLYLTPFTNISLSNPVINLQSNAIHSGKDEELSFSYYEWNENTLPGSEIAVVISEKYHKSICNIKFTVGEHYADSSRVRINLYDGIMPDEKTARKLKSLYHTIKDNHSVVSLEVNLEDINADKALIIGVEYIEHFGNQEYLLQFKTKNDVEGTLVRSTSQDSYQTIPFITPIFIDSGNNLDFTQEESSNQKSINFIEGKVFSDNVPLQGCEVRVKNKLFSTLTKSDGSFAIRAELGDVIRCESLTTLSEEFVINDKDDLEIHLKPKYDKLEEVRITGRSSDYGEEELNSVNGMVKRKQIGYALYTKEKEELNKSAVSIGELIIGRFPGLIVYGPDKSRFKMRGNSTFTGGDSPLFVVDGVPFTAGPPQLDINLVTDVTVIPGLNGTTRYGTLARNGVIIVNTIQSQFKSQKPKEAKNPFSLLAQGNDYNESLSTYDENLFDGSNFIVKDSDSYKSARDKYFTQIADNVFNVSFYLEAFQYFYDRDKDFSFSILKALEKIANNDIKTLRCLAFIYEHKGEYLKAHKLYKRIGVLDSQNPQSYVDLAQSFLEIGEFKEAFSLYKLILDDRIPQVVFSEDIQEVAVTEVKHLVTKYKNKVDYRDLTPSFYNQASTLDSRILIEWNDPLSQFEVQFVNPDDKFFTWSYSLMSNLKVPINSERDGYQTKDFFLKDALKGNWLINLNNLKFEENTKSTSNIPKLIKCTIYTNYGLPTEEKMIKILDLNDIQQNTSIASINL